MRAEIVLYIKKTKDIKLSGVILVGRIF